MPQTRTLTPSIYPASPLVPVYPEPMVPPRIYARRADGRMETIINEDWLGLSRFGVQAEQPAGTQVIAVGAGARVQASMSLNAKRNWVGSMRILQLQQASTGTFSVEAYHNTLGRQLMNVPIPRDNIFGANARFPGRPHEAIPFDAVSSILWAIFETSGVPITVRFEASGPRYNRSQPMSAREQFQRGLSHAYWLGPTASSVAGQPVAGEVAIGALATATLFFQVPSDAYFDWAALNDSSTGGYNIQIFDGLEGDSLMTAPVPIGFIASVTTAGFPAAGNPAFFLQSIAQDPKTTLRVVVTDTSGAPNTIRLTLVGSLIYAGRRG